MIGDRQYLLRFVVVLFLCAKYSLFTQVGPLKKHNIQQTFKFLSVHWHPGFRAQFSVQTSISHIGHLQILWCLRLGGKVPRKYFASLQSEE
uniref:Uncharacterized protein n=1 Tax=Anguilla anguilla TaxID=7936 RepID=A0A0E9XAR8_ANGAN